MDEKCKNFSPDMSTLFPRKNWQIRYLWISKQLSKLMTEKGTWERLQKLTIHSKRPISQKALKYSFFNYILSDILYKPVPRSFWGQLDLLFFIIDSTGKNKGLCYSVKQVYNHLIKLLSQYSFIRKCCFYVKMFPFFNVRFSPTQKAYLETYG